MQIGLADGDGLGAGWAQVLKCLSEFQRLHMIGTGAKTDAQLFFPGANDASARAKAATTGILKEARAMRKPTLRRQVHMMLLAALITQNMSKNVLSGYVGETLERVERFQDWARSAVDMAPDEVSAHNVLELCVYAGHVGNA